MARKHHKPEEIVAKLRQLFSVRWTKASDYILPSALLLVSLGKPRADRLRGRLELTGKVVGVAPRTGQSNHLAAKLRDIGRSGFRHDDTFRVSVRGVHQTGSIPDCLFVECAPAGGQN